MVIPPTPRGSCGSSRSPGQRQTYSSCGLSDQCPIRVLLDDIDVTEDVGFLVRTWDLAGAEFYSAASTPVQYRDTRAGCGVLLLWTRR